MSVISSERLWIQPLTLSDKALFLELYTDPKTMRLISEPFPPKQALDAFNRVIDSMSQKEGRFAQWVLREKDSEKAIGLIGLVWPEETRSQAEFGLMLTRSANGKGLPEEVMLAFMPYAFHTLKLEKIMASFSNRNLPAKRLAEKIGAHFDNTKAEENNLSCYLSR